MELDELDPSVELDELDGLNDELDDVLDELTTDELLDVLCSPPSNSLILRSLNAQK